MAMIVDISKEKVDLFDFSVEFIVDGEKIIKTVTINVADKEVGKNLVSVQDRINEKVKKVEAKNVEFKSKELPKSLDTFDDFASMTREQADDVLNYIDAIEDYETKLNDIMIKEISDSLKVDCSPIFEYIRPLDDYNGEPFAVAVLTQLGNEILAHMKKVAKQKEKEAQKKANKKDYLRKYR